MDSFEWNKVAAAVLVGLLFFMGVNLLSEGVFEGEKVVVGIEAPAGEDQPSEVVLDEPETNILALIADANLGAGERSFRKCQACHTVNEGGGHRVGPNLFNVVGGNVASKDGYAYSSALSGKGGSWTYEELDTFLSSPATAVPGTKMTFAGIRTPEERANLIAYLRSQSANPIPLPEVPASEEAAEETPETVDGTGE